MMFTLWLPLSYWAYFPMVTNYGLILGKSHPWLFLQSTFPQTDAEVITHLLLFFCIHTRQQVKHEIKINTRVPVTYFPPLSKHRPDVLKPTLTNKIKPKITKMYTHFTQLYIAGNFPIWPMMLGSVEESGYQHVHLTIWTFPQLNQ